MRPAAAAYCRFMPFIDQPALTPMAALEALRSRGHAVLLESARVNERTGRYSFVTAEPYLIFRSKGENVELSLPATPAGKYGRRASVNKKPLLKLRELLANYRTERIEGLPPFTWRGSGVLFLRLCSSIRGGPAAGETRPRYSRSLFRVRRPGRRLRPSPEPVLDHRESRRAGAGDGVPQARSGPVGTAL